MIRKILLFFGLIVYSEAQTLQQFKANGQGVVAGLGAGSGGPWIFDLPPLNLQPLQLRLNPSTTPADEPALFLIRQNESIPVTYQDQNSLQNWSQSPQTAQQLTPQWTQSAAHQWTQPLQTYGVQLQQQSPQTPLPPTQTQLQAPQIQSLQAVDQTKPLMPLAFQAFSQTSSIPSPLLGLSANGINRQNLFSGAHLQPPRPIAQTANPTFVQNWQTPQQVSTTPVWAQNLQLQRQTLTANTKPQITQTFTNFGQKQLTQLSQPTVQQNLQTLKRNDVPNTSAYELTDITPILQSLASYTPQPPQLSSHSSQSQQFNQLQPQSGVGQQFASQVTNQNIKYFPSVTLPAVNLPSNQLPIKLIDLNQLSQFSQTPSNTISGITGLQKNPDRSTWSTKEKGEAATLIPQTLTAPKPLSSFNSLKSNVWSKPSPLNSLLAKRQPIPQTLTVQKTSPIVQQLPTFSDALTASVQSWAQSTQQTGPSPTNPVSPFPSSLSANGVQPVVTSFQPQVTHFQPLTTPLQPSPLQPIGPPLGQTHEAPVQSFATPVQFSAPIKPFPTQSQLSQLQSIPLTFGKSANLQSWPTATTQQNSALKPLSSITPINQLPIGMVAPPQQLGVVQPMPALRPIPASTYLKPWSSIAPVKPFSVPIPVSALPQPQPITATKSTPLQSWPTSINQQLSSLKPLSSVTPINPLPASVAPQQWQPLAYPKPLAIAQPWKYQKPVPVSAGSLKSWSSQSASKPFAKL
jgi:hypothetical protein